MADYREDVFVLCPYYKKEVRKNLICEGVVGISTTSYFPSIKELENYKNDFCRCKCYAGCLLYQAIQEREGQ